MVFTIIYIILALGIDAVIFIFTGLYQFPWFYWVPVLAFPILYLVLFAITLGILFLVSKTIDINKEVTKPSKVARFWVTQVIRQIHMLVGVIVKKSGFYKIPHGQPYLIVYNHMSNFDPMLIMDYLHKDKVICVTKPENLKAPIAGPFIHKAGYIAIDRENATEGTKAILKAVDYINKGYGIIAISPEGTRSKSGELLPFHPGSFQIGYRAQVPVVVCGFKNTNQIHKNVLRRFTRVNMDILAVIPYEEYKDIPSKDFAEQVHKMYEEYMSKE